MNVLSVPQHSNELGQGSFPNFSWLGNLLRAGLQDNCTNAEVEVTHIRRLRKLNMHRTCNVLDDW